VRACTACDEKREREKKDEFYEFPQRALLSQPFHLILTSSRLTLSCDPHITEILEYAKWLGMEDHEVSLSAVTLTLTPFQWHFRTQPRESLVLD